MSAPNSSTGPERSFYADESGELLVSDRYRLTGRPDYILKSAGELIPVERKSRNVSLQGPFEGEFLQFAAYCLLVEETHHTAVLRGHLQYLNRSIDVPFDGRLRDQLKNALVAIEQASGLRDVPRSHKSAARCRACGFRERCGQALQ
jgi:CRISPR-associated exonuclease Cas4